MVSGWLKGMINSTYLEKENNEKVEVAVPTPHFLEGHGPWLDISFIRKWLLPFINSLVLFDEGEKMHQGFES